jgi:diguanylate cyclase (GGDEF)-like protein/PAS domain S-box-containing protein
MSFDHTFCKQVLDEFHEGVYFVDLDRKILYWNKSAEMITGYSASEVVGHCCSEGILDHIDEKGNNLCFSECPLSTSLNGSEVVSTHAFLRHKRGHRVAVSIQAIPMIYEGKVYGAIEAFLPEADVQQAVITNKELEFLALYDPLTGLPNRRYIDNYLSNHFRDYDLFEISFAVIMLDLDHFKNVNDQYGHDIGDAVLKMVSKTLKNALRASDFVGRWGGEEFLAIVRCNSNEDLFTISEKIRVLIEKSKLRAGDQDIKITISAGCTLVNKSDDPASISKRADSALYYCKNNGRNMSYIL